MKFRIHGVSDQKIIVSLKKLTNSFFVVNSFVENDADFELFFNINDMRITLTSKDDYLEEPVFTFTHEENNQKYAILVIYYKLLSKMTKTTLPWGVLSGIRPTKLAHRYMNQDYSSEEILYILQRKYMLEEQKAQLLIDLARRQRETIPHFNDISKGISIYINIPYCLSRCTYCSFTSFNVNYPFVSMDDYIDKLLEEIAIISKYIKEHHIKVTSIYIGGGTPTALSEVSLKQLLDQIEESFDCQSLLEYTLESGRPDTLSKGKLELIKRYSVTRISINPQTFTQSTLDRVNRSHQVEDIIHSFRLARDLGFDNINMDLILGLPDETMEDVLNSIDKTLKLDPESITVHTLAYKRGSTLYDKNELVKGNLEVEKMFNYCYELIKSSDYKPYYLYRQKNIIGNLENIGYAKEGYVSIYNILMIEELQNIIGLGCGASSKFLNNEIILNPKDLISYVKSYKDYLDKKLTMLKMNVERVGDMTDE